MAALSHKKAETMVWLSLSVPFLSFKVFMHFSFNLNFEFNVDFDPVIMLLLPNTSSVLIYER